MNYEFDNFVLSIENFFTQEECEMAISQFHRFESLGLIYDRTNQTNKAHMINDGQLFSNIAVECSELDVQEFSVANLFANKFWEFAYSPYSNKYSILKEVGKHTIRSVKVQRTRVGEGYHVWHCEDTTVLTTRRILTFVLYLNDVEEGGETELLYYPKRHKATAGKLIVFPAGFTHTHRGNPPISNTKYIMTGWLEIID